MNHSSKRIVVRAGKRSNLQSQKNNTRRMAGRSHGSSCDAEPNFEIIFYPWDRPAIRGVIPSFRQIYKSIRVIREIRGP
jgi:hypothetical protein